MATFDVPDPAPHQVENLTTDVLDAIYSGITKVRRRIEIYERDGETIWRPDIPVRAKEGSVTVSYDSDVRRTLDLKLDNSEGNIVHNAQGGFWYDKIIKCFRGVNFTNPRKLPRLGLVGFNDTQGDTALRFLQRVGAKDYFVLDITQQIPDEVDLLVAWAFNTDFTTRVAAFLADAYSRGYSILTVCNYATPATVPLITTNTARVGTVAGTIIPVTNTDTPFLGTFQRYATTSVSGENLVSAFRATARAAATDTYSGATVYPIIYEVNAAGGKWVHYQPQLRSVPGATSSLNQWRQNQVMLAAMRWLYEYHANLYWETQVGEFMIDTIISPNFPHEMSIAGRDYCKRFDLYKLEKATTFSAGTKLDDVVAGIAFLAEHDKLKLGMDGKVLDADRPYDFGQSGLDILKDLSTGYNMEFFMDRFGFLVTRPFIDPATANPSIRLATGYTDPDRANLVSFTKTSTDAELYNVVVASQDADSSGNNQFYSIAVNDDDSTPSSTNKIGRRVYPVPSEIVFDTQEAQQDFVNRMLAVKSLETFQVDFSSLVFPWVEAGEILDFIDPNDSYFPKRHLFTDFSIPMGLGAMTGTGKRVALIASTNG